jgi:hypothetical protein
MRTRLRRLHVGERTFVWLATIHHVPGNHDCHRGIRVRAWGSGKNSQALQADLLSLSWPSPWAMCATDNAYPTSADILALTSYALDNGWRPEVRGGTFMLPEDSPGFPLPDFVLTDRLRTPEAEDPTTRVIRAHEAASEPR